MKKLMIVAAVAAMAGGVFAVDGYNFTATLKTTQGRKGTDVISTLQLGKNALGQFWYEDARYTEITNRLSGYWYATKVIDGNTVDTVAKVKAAKDTTPVDMSKGTFLRYDSTTNYADVVALLTQMARKNAGEYDIKSAGKWCEEIKVIDPAKCYRVAGSKKIDQDFESPAGWGDYTDCCTPLATLSVGAEAFTNLVVGPVSAGVNPLDADIVFDNDEMAIAYSTHQTNDLISAAHTLYQRFGAQTSARANRLEIYANIPYAVTDDGYVFAGWIAGQGTARFADSMEANTISGNIVGVIEAPECENCCTAPTPSWAFDCLTGTAPEQLPYSAAYGTFRLRYVRSL